MIQRRGVLQLLSSEVLMAKKQTEAERLAERKRVDDFYKQKQREAVARRARTAKPAAKPTAQQKAVKRSEKRVSGFGAGWAQLLKALGMK